MWKLILLAVVVVTSSATNSYVVVAPSKVRANMDLSLSVNILNATGDVTVVASLLREQTTVVSATKVFQEGSPGTLNMKLPADLPSSTYTLNVKGSGGLTFDESENLNYNNKETSVFIQINKAIFKPGDIVNFRVFGVYSDLKSYTDPVDISIYDADSNKIKQWLQVTPTNGVIAQELTLSTQPVLGDWKISVEAGRTKEEKVFTVAEYVLPKFEVDVVMPTYAMTTDNDVTVIVKSKYTYGKPVNGTADVLVKLQNEFIKSIDSKYLQVINVKLRLNGEAKVIIPMSQVKAFNPYLNQRVLIVIANVTESLTGNQMSGNGTVTLYDKGVKLEFPESNPKTFKPGLQYIAYLKISQPDDLPIISTNEKVVINIRVTSDYFSDILSDYSTSVLSLAIPENGLVTIPVDVPDYATDVYVTATFRGVSEKLTLEKTHSPSSSYIQMRLMSGPAIKAGESISFEIKGTRPLATLVYQILSRGEMVKTGTVDANGQLVYQFSIPSDPSMAPNARIVVYYVRDNGEIVTDSISFDISGVFKNKVSIDLDKTDVEPGDDVTLTVKADPDSTAYCLAIDQSVLLLKGGNDVTDNDVFTELKEYDSNEDKNRKSMVWWRRFPIGLSRRWQYPVYLGGNDAYEILENAGVVVLTDAIVFRYWRPRFRETDDISWDLGLFRPNRFREFDLEFRSSIDTEIMTPPKTSELQIPTRTRTVFSETFFWSNVTISANGSASITATVPDTITSWVASAFAINSASGLGVAQTQAHLRVFRPFFVSLNLPYSVTRGEHLALQANVFNYMTEDMQVRVTLAKSDNFFNIEIDANGAEVLKQVESVQDVMIKAGEAKSVYFPIVPADLGKIDIEVKAQSTKAADAVRRQLLVEAEGVPKIYNVPVLIDLTEGKTSFSKTVDLTLPSNTVKGSELARISAVGDLMGPTIAGLDSLLQMPTGCGEQTMVNLAPNVYVTDYLKSVNQLSADIRTKALNFMESGYQRELTYKHTDGSFSAFGNRDASGSMWLTAFVTRVFKQAKAHIYIDDEVLIKAIQWMVSKQNDDGSFPEPGVVLNKKMQGQAGSGVGLSLYVLISLFENEDVLANTLLVDEARQKALAYAEQEVSKTDDLYILNMATYAFQLANSSQVQTVLNKLEQKATVKDGRKHWHQPDQPKTTNTWDYPNPTKAVDIEMTSYALLTYAARGNIVAGKSIMQWLTEQRNSNGGFSSTQDTVVALNALSDFAKQTYSNNFNVQITTQLNATTSYTFNIDKTNSLVLQSRETPDVPSQVKIEARGSGMALVQVAVSFNVESEIFETTFDLTVKLIEETINHLFVETCAKWRGKGPSSAMAVEEIGIPSGFEADLESFPQMDILKRIETQNKKVILYFDQIGTTPVCLNFRAVRTGLIAKSQPAAIRVYDYYEPRNQVTAFYQSQILKDSTVCDVCKECDNCV
ncbi:CD109 antigen-like isoform X2 [Biomphalaria glabrata]|uniref:CD109 antigen n=1 Tax=Biomphalaria glabrata TaxID=6526 RepID=A0A9W3B4J5_BIOGL|nr:CD109 antigen-like isoform X2 [Biomphalaria glabrata]